MACNWCLDICNFCSMIDKIPIHHTSYKPKTCIIKHCVKFSNYEIYVKLQNAIHEWALL